VDIPSTSPAAALVLQLLCTLNYHVENEGSPGLVAQLHWTPLLDAMACAYPSPMMRLIDCKRYVHDLSIEPHSRSPSPQAQRQHWCRSPSVSLLGASVIPLSTARILLAVAGRFIYWPWPPQGMNWRRHSYIPARCKPTWSIQTVGGTSVFDYAEP